MKHSTLSAFLAAGLLLSGCIDELPERGGEGRLSLDLSTDASVAEVLATRAVVPGLVAPEKSAFSLLVTRDDSGEEFSWDDITQCPEPVSLPVAGYTAEVLCGDIAQEGFGKPCFGATESFTIVEGEEEAVTLNARLLNMAVTVEYTDAFKEYFSEYSTTVSRGGSTIASFADDETRAAFLKPEPFKVKVDYTLDNGVSAVRKGSAEYDVTEHIGAATLLRVKFDVNGGEVGSAGISVIFNDAQPVTLEPIDVGETE